MNKKIITSVVAAFALFAIAVPSAFAAKKPKKVPMVAITTEACVGILQKKGVSVKIPETFDYKTVLKEMYPGEDAETINDIENGKLAAIIGCVKKAIKAGEIANTKVFYADPEFGSFSAKAKNGGYQGKMTTNLKVDDQTFAAEIFYSFGNEYGKNDDGLTELRFTVNNTLKPVAGSTAIAKEIPQTEAEAYIESIKKQGDDQMAEIFLKAIANYVK